MRNCSTADEGTFGMISNDHFGMAPFSINTQRTPSLKSAHDAIFSTIIVSVRKASLSARVFDDVISL